MGRLNRPAQEGYTYRSPGQTNARDLLPNLGEDVISSQRADAERISRGMNPTAAREYNRMLQQEAGGRAATRTAGRAGLAGLALDTGYELGRAIDEKTGIGKKIVDKSGLGDVVDKVVNMRDKVELSPRAKEKAADSDDSDSGPDKFKPRYSEGDFGMKKGGKVKKMASGGKVSSASSRADGCCVKGKTKGRYL
jgi:hypothetical protein